MTFNVEYPQIARREKPLRGMTITNHRIPALTVSNDVIRQNPIGASNFPYHTWYDNPGSPLQLAQEKLGRVLACRQERISPPIHRGEADYTNHRCLFVY
jgi:hypothetical protein